MSSDGSPDLKWVRKSGQLNWLIWSIEKARRLRRSDEELLAALRRGLPKSERESALREIEDRLAADREGFQAKMLAVLTHLAGYNNRPGPAAQETDRLLRRLLWRVPDDEARAMAFSCAQSPRLQRRIAAWRFYAAHGLDADARAVLAGHAKEKLHEHLAKLVIHDAELLEQVGLEEVLIATEDPYWRGRIFETWLSVKEPVTRLFESHPSEALFAIRRAERRDLLQLGHRLFQDNRSDPEVVAAAIQLFGALNSPAEQAGAVAAGLELLEEVPDQEKKWMRLDLAIDRLRSDPLTDSDAVNSIENSHPQPALW